MGIRKSVILEIRKSEKGSQKIRKSKNQKIRKPEIGSENQKIWESENQKISNWNRKSESENQKP